MELNAKRRSKKRRVCLAKNCNMSSNSLSFEENHLTMFPFPTDPERCNAWLKLIGRTDLAGSSLPRARNSCVCSLHFEESDVLREVKLTLKPDALPFLNQTSEMPRTQAAAPAAAAAAAAAAVSCCELEAATDYLASLGMQQFDAPPAADVFFLDDALLAAAAADPDHATRHNYTPLEKLQIFIKRHLNMASKLRDQAKFRDMALNLLLSNPEAYKFLQPKCVLQLPSVASLRNSCVPTLYGSTSGGSLVELLGIRSQYMPASARYCSLFLTTVSLRPRLFYDTAHDAVEGLAGVGPGGHAGPAAAGPGGHAGPAAAGPGGHAGPAATALVATLRARHPPWTQPISYYFVAAQQKLTDIDSWLTDLITKLKDVGLIVQTITVPPTEEFYDYAADKQITNTNPFFMENVLFIFDAPRLICRMCEIFAEKPIYLGTEVAKYEFVDTVNKLVNMTDATPSYLESSENTVSTKVVEQTLGRSVAAAIDLYVNFKSLPREAQTTASFIRAINDSLDIVNKPVTKVNKKVTLSQLEQKTYDTMQVLGQLRSDADVEFTKDIQKSGEMLAVTVSSISSLILSQSDDRKRFDPRHLTLKPLDAMLVKLRSYSGGGGDMTCRQFLRSFRSLYKFYMFIDKKPQPSKRENLREFTERLERMPGLSARPARARSAVALDEPADYRFPLPRRDALVFAAACLQRECAARHACGARARGQARLAGMAHFARAAERAPPGLRMPELDFIVMVRRLDERFVRGLPGCLRSRPGATLAAALADVDWCHTCPCFPKRYLIRLFVRFRMYTAMKRINRMLAKNELDYACV